MSTEPTLPGWRAAARAIAGVAVALVAAATTLSVTPAAADATGATVTWSPLATSGAPSARSGAAMAFDASSGQIVLFGGRNAAGDVLGDTWVYTQGKWTEVCANHCGPDAATGASMAFDPDLDQLVLFGGQTAFKPAAQFSDATWTWNGRQWYRPPTSEQDPPRGRADAAFAVDDSGPTGSVVLYGGTGVAGGALSPAGSPAATNDATTTLADTWTWDGSAWSQQQPAASPPARTGAAATWDPGLDAVVLFGGAPTAGLGGWLDDTWLWRRDAWIPVPLALSPSPRADTSLDYQGSLNTVVAYGGQTASGAADDTWEFAGFGWTPLQAGTPPVARSQAASTWDSASNSVVLFGGVGANGSVLGDTATLAGPTAVVGGSPPTSAAGASTSTSTPPPGSINPRVAPSSTTTTGPHVTTVPGGPSPANAPPGPSSLAVTSQRVRRGAQVGVSGRGFAPGARVTVAFHSTPARPIAATTADASGAFSVFVTVPTDAHGGWHHLTATGRGPTGGVLTLESPVLVSAVSSHPSRPASQIGIMVGLALFIPLASWLVLGYGGRLRHRPSSSS